MKVTIGYHAAVKSRCGPGLALTAYKRSDIEEKKKKLSEYQYVYIVNIYSIFTKNPHCNVLTSKAGSATEGIALVHKFITRDTALAASAPEVNSV